MTEGLKTQINKTWILELGFVYLLICFFAIFWQQAVKWCWNTKEQICTKTNNNICRSIIKKKKPLYTEHIQHQDVLSVGILCESHPLTEVLTGSWAFERTCCAYAMTTKMATILNRQPCLKLSHKTKLQYWPVWNPVCSFHAVGSLCGDEFKHWWKMTLCSHMINKLEENRFVWPEGMHDRS